MRSVTAIGREHFSHCTCMAGISGETVARFEWRAITNGLGIRSLGLERLWEGRPPGSVPSGVGAREGGKLDLIARDPS